MEIQTAIVQLIALTESEIVVTDARFQFSVLLVPSLSNDKVGFINVFSCKYLIINIIMIIIITYI